jgi:hypothetical protein
MSQLNVNTIKNRVGNSGPTFDGNTTVSGILTATSFSGDGSSLTNLTLTGDGDLANLDVTGVSTFAGNINASSADFSGNVTIGGTLTYRDVTNIDAVGMVTARKGIQVLADGLTVTGITTVGTALSLADNVKAKFGTGGDLEIYHSSTASHITDVGTGNFIIGSNGGSLKITKGADTENMAVFTPDGSAALYYDNVKKFETVTGGVDITGDLTANSGSDQVKLGAGDGAIEITRSAGGAYIDFKNDTGEDYDARLSESSGALETSGNLNVGNDLIVTNSAYTSISTTDTNKTIVNREYVTAVTGVAGTNANITITLPASPNPGWEVGVAVGGTFLDTVVARNGSKIMALSEDMTLNRAYISVQFVYVDAYTGWRFF